MPGVATVADRYIGVWNEPNASIRRNIIRELWAPECVHYMGSLEARGYDALEKRIAASHEKNVTHGGCQFRPTKSFDVLRNVAKFGWEMTRTQSGAVESAGSGFLILGADGRILFDYLFVDS